jgi:hypothetical protein
VLGCLDVMALPDGLPRLNRRIKETLLEQCGIQYWAVPYDKLPDPETLRAEFLSNLMASAHPVALEPPASQFQALEDVRQRLHQTLDRNRAAHRHSAPDALDSRPFDSQMYDSRPFEHESDHGFAPTQPSDFMDLPAVKPAARLPDSFLSPLQSKRAGLDQV